MSASDILRDAGLDVPEAVAAIEILPHAEFTIDSRRTVAEIEPAIDLLLQYAETYRLATEALAREVAHRERIIDHLIAEEHLTPHGREARRKWLDENCGEP